VISASGTVSGRVHNAAFFYPGGGRFAGESRPVKAFDRTLRN
jgi:hypothetical protein